MTRKGWEMRAAGGTNSNIQKKRLNWWICGASDRPYCSEGLTFIDSEESLGISILAMALQGKGTAWRSSFLKASLAQQAKNALETNLSRWSRKHSPPLLEDHGGTDYISHTKVRFSTHLRRLNKSFTLLRGIGKLTASATLPCRVTTSLLVLGK